MKVLNRHRLRDVSRAHPDAAEALMNWWQVTQRAHWATFSQVRQTFRSASYVDPHVIFNIKGNDYRLVTYIDYERGFVVMKWFGTHAEYDKEGWK
jgi:mRNA interferase HigB